MPFLKDNKSLTAIKRADEYHAQRVAELERTIADLQGVLRDLATSTLQLLDLSPPRKAADAAIIGDIVKRARKVLAYLKSPRH